MVAGADAAVPGVPVSDTVKRLGDGCLVAETLDRSRLVAVQTPQAFRAEVLRGAHGAGLGVKDAILASWPSRLADWLSLHELSK